MKNWTNKVSVYKTFTVTEASSMWLEYVLPMPNRPYAFLRRPDLKHKMELIELDNTFQISAQETGRRHTSWLKLTSRKFAYIASVELVE